ncbi:MAG TPA: D-alanine--D-alanine ligase [Patescibacteria group bacterium]|nr:D-alanine--D-alanine ligase [Patescibacteria group bacterium]
MNIAVLLGGISSERNISLLSGRAITRALREKGHSVKAIDPMRGADGLMTDEELDQVKAAEITAAELKKFDPRKLMECINSDLFNDVEVVFIALHGKYGEDGSIQTLLELRGIPYTGTNVLSSAIAMDKNMSKMLFASGGVSTAPWIAITREQFEDMDLISEIRGELGRDLVIKANDQGSTVGMYIVKNAHQDEIKEAIAKAGDFSDMVLIEKYIAGRELTVPVVGDEALPIIEIIPHEGFYDFTNKYTKGNTEYVCPADLSADVTDFVQNLAIAAHRSLGCSVLSRVDFRLDEDNQPFCLEVNTIPGFTETSLVPKAAKEVGIEFGDLCEQIIELSRKK